MKTLLIRLDDQTLVALHRIAPANRKRSEFVRGAIRDAVRRAEYEAIRDAYRKQPDSSLDFGEWKPA